MTKMANYFQIFKIEESFLNLDKKFLEEIYSSLQKKYHPDLATSNLEREIFQRQSALLNIAYNNLLDDKLRMIHLLELKNILVDELIPESDFLKLIFEINFSSNKTSELTKLYDNLKNNFDLYYKTSNLEMLNSLGAKLIYLLKYST